jgi:hypothetical protein
VRPERQFGGEFMARPRLIDAQEGFEASSEPLLEGLTTGKRPRERTLFSKRMAFGGKEKGSLSKRLAPDSCAAPLQGRT